MGLRVPRDAALLCAVLTDVLKNQGDTRNTICAQLLLTEIQAVRKIHR